jgi:tetratricopeptide (TPR) repeat protein
MEALEVRGYAYYKLNEHEMAFNHWRQALHFDPEHETLKELYRTLKKLDKHNNRGDKAHGDNDHVEAINHWKAAMEVDKDHKHFIHPTQVCGVFVLSCLLSLSLSLSLISLYLPLYALLKYEIFIDMSLYVLSML